MAEIPVSLPLVSYFGRILKCKRRANPSPCPAQTFENKKINHLQAVAQSVSPMLKTDPPDQRLTCRGSIFNLKPLIFGIGTSSVAHPASVELPRPISYHPSGAMPRLSKRFRSVPFRHRNPLLPPASGSPLGRSRCVAAGFVAGVRPEYSVR